MNESIIICPKCAAEIKLTESLAAPLVEALRQQYEQKIAQKDIDVRNREAEIQKQLEALSIAEKKIDEKVSSKLELERKKIIDDEARKARLALSNDLEQKARENTELLEILKERDFKLGEAQKAQAELIRKERALDDAKREMELNIEKRVQDSLTTVREKAARDVEDGFKLKVLEKEQTISSMQKQIEELKRRAEQGSQQLQGEVQELEMESILRNKFPQDIIEAVAKGEFGGDIIQRVMGSTGQQCGIILWETKRTKNWNDNWLAKLREDQRAVNAEISIIVSQVLPKGIDTFDMIDGVWVTDTKCAIPVAIALRHSLIELNCARQAGEGQQTKMEIIYQYLTGSRFRHRVQAIVEKFTDMHDDLDKERKTMTRLWAKRDEQIRCVIEATAGMYGDLQGIAGKSLQEIEGLSMKFIQDESNRD